MKMYIHDDFESVNYPYNFYISEHKGIAEQIWDLPKETYERHQKWIDACKFSDIGDAANCLEALGGKQIE